MKSKRRNAAKLKDFEKVLLMIMMHFRSWDDERDLTCYRCQDWTSGMCPGEGRSGAEVIECMRDHARDDQWGMI